MAFRTTPEKTGLHLTNVATPWKAPIEAGRAKAASWLVTEAAYIKKKQRRYEEHSSKVSDGVLGERGDGVFDFATVALHKSGHALSRAHFGDVAIHHKKGSRPHRPQS